MILLVPVTPEVPKEHAPMLWPALLLLLMLGVGFISGYETIQSDFEYVNSIGGVLVEGEDGRPQLSESAHAYLAKRPLLQIAPAKGDWDISRLLAANFLHGSVPHLVLNWIGVFAGARICTTFIPFLLTLSIFVLGGSVGLWASLMLSAEASAFIPHIGASGGIFALMGTYYVYNFRFRTRYFFWFPSRQGSICLRTSWFFFLDVILLELVLSMAQFLPERVDSVDHLAHVVGFASGLVLAFGLRFFQRWPGFLQTRDEFLHWVRLPRGKQVTDPHRTAFDTWVQLLRINPYNDQVKNELCDLVAKHPDLWSELDLETAFGFLSPTYLRLQTGEAAAAVAAVLARPSPLPAAWLKATPYDSIIRLAQAMAQVPEHQRLLIELVTAYRRAHPEGGNTERKLELLVAKLSTLQGTQKSA